MMFIALVALGDLLPLPPPPVILSLTPDTAPLSAPATGLSPLAAASPPLATALPMGPPLPMSSSLSVSPPTRSVTVSMAFEPRERSTSCPTSFSLSIGSTFAMTSPPPARARTGLLGRALLGGALLARRPGRGALLGRRLLGRRLLRGRLLGGSLLGRRLLRRRLLRGRLLGGRL